MRQNPTAPISSLALHSSHVRLAIILIHRCPVNPCGKLPVRLMSAHRKLDDAWVDVGFWLVTTPT